MPARRLLLVVALLMLGLALASGLGVGEDTGKDASRPAPTGRSAETAIVAATLSPSGGRPQRVMARIGDLVRLQVMGTAPDSVAVEGYDAVETVDADTPARFEFVAERPGTFPVRFTSSGRLAGELVVRARRAG